MVAASVCVRLWGTGNTNLYKYASVKHSLYHLLSLSVASGSLAWLLSGLNYGQDTQSLAKVPLVSLLKLWYVCGRLKCSLINDMPRKYFTIMYCSRHGDWVQKCSHVAASAWSDICDLSSVFKEEHRIEFPLFWNNFMKIKESLVSKLMRLAAFAISS